MSYVADASIAVPVMMSSVVGVCGAPATGGWQRKCRTWWHALQWGASMPAESNAQRRLMAAAEHGATFPAAEKLRASMTHRQLHDYAATPEKGLPAHVKPPRAKFQSQSTFEHHGFRKPR